MRRRCLWLSTRYIPSNHRKSQHWSWRPGEDVTDYLLTRRGIEHHPRHNYPQTTQSKHEDRQRGPAAGTESGTKRNNPSLPKLGERATREVPLLQGQPDIGKCLLVRGELLMDLFLRLIFPSDLFLSRRISSFGSGKVLGLSCSVPNPHSRHS
jgi:hypothetical protein